MKIKTKLYAIIASLIASFSILLVQTLSEFRSISEKNTLLEESASLVLNAGNMGMAVNQVLLASMDIIVDKDSGEVSPDLIEEIEEGGKVFNQSLAEISKIESSKQYEEKIKYTQEKFALLQKSVEELIVAVKARAPAESFARFDDVIDGTGAEIADILKGVKENSFANFSLAQNDVAQIISESERSSKFMNIGITIAISIVLILISRSITNPIKSISESIEHIADGDTNREIPTLRRKDEIADIARSLDILRQKVEEAFKLKQMVDEMPINILTANVADNFKIDYANKAAIKTLRLLEQYIPIAADQVLGQSIDIFHKDPGVIRRLLSEPANLPHSARVKLGNEVIDQKISAVFDRAGKYLGPMLSWTLVTQNDKLASSFETSIGSVSTQIASSATTLQQRADYLQHSITELSGAALDISKRVHESLKIIGTAVTKGSDARNHMSNLSSSAEKVSNVVNLIRAIAEKTNLLALNATIESARAGEFGKGFAVVANEVKTLATQTAVAIVDINDQVAEMQTAAAGTFETVKEMCDILDAVSKISSEIAGTVEEQQASTSDIAGSVGNSSSTQSSESIIAMAAQLKDVSIVLQNECDAFLDKVRKM